MGIVIAILGFILAVPLRTGIIALRAQLVAINVAKVATGTTSSTMSLLRKAKIGAKALGKSDEDATKVGRVVASAAHKATVVALKASIASLKALLALLNSLVLVLQALDIVGLIILLLIIVVLLVAISSALMVMQDENLQSAHQGVFMGSSVVQSAGDSSDSSNCAEWISVCDELGDWYAANISTYQGGNGVRKGYICDSVKTPSGDSVTVYDDCSAFVTACLQKAGYLSTNSSIYCSYDFIDGGGAASYLKSAGFTHIGSLQTNEGNLKKGDILAVSGHVEIFSHYGTDNSIYAWTWGSVYSSLPAKKATEAGGYQYTDIWRLS